MIASVSESIGTLGRYPVVGGIAYVGDFFRSVMSLLTGQV
jgi:hypothetical protein